MIRFSNSNLLQKNGGKDFNELIKEVSMLNKHTQYNFNNLKSCIDRIEFCLNDYIKFNIFSIKEEFNKIKLDFNSDNNKIKLIALMIQANYCVFNYYPRYTQLISFFFFISKKSNTGLIQEIKTGEGKSLIISFLAVYNRLIYNKKIDILTSSIVLAERDCNLYKKFYDIFYLKTDFCRNELDNTK